MFKPFYITIIFILFSQLRIAGQSPLPVTDSLRKVLNHLHDDSAKSLVLAELAYKYYTIPDSLYLIAKRGLLLATDIKYDRGIAANKFSLGVYYSDIGDYSKSMELVFASLLWQHQHGTKKAQARCHTTLGILSANMGDNLNGIRNMKKAYNLFKASVDVEGVLMTLNNLGYLYTQESKLDSALLFLQEGMILAKKINSINNIVYLTGSISELFLKKHDLDNAKKYVLESILINNDVDFRIQSYNYTLLAQIYREYQLIDKAETCLLRAVVMAKKVKASADEAKSYEILSEIYFSKHHYQKAFVYFRKSVEIKNTMFSEEKEKDRKALIHKFEIDEKESRIKILEQDNKLRLAYFQLQQDKIGSQRFYLILLVIVFSLSLLLLFSIMKQGKVRKKHIKLLEEKNNEIYYKASQLKILNDELDVINKNLESKVRERAAVLLSQAKKLDDYAFINSHSLRGPVASLLGLIHLLENNYLSEQERQFAFASFKMEVSRVDEIIKEINKAIE